MSEKGLAISTPKVGSPAEALAGNQSKDYHPALVLLHGLSAAVQEQGKKQGNYLLGDLELEPPINIMCFGMRHHAVLMENRSKIAESFDRDSPIYKDIEGTRTNYSSGVDSRHGLEFLLWLPQQGRWAVLHPNTWSARTKSNAPERLCNCIYKPEDRSEAYRDLPWTMYFQLGSKLITGKQNKYHVPDVTPIDVRGRQEEYQDWIPDEKSIEEAIAVFEKPVAAEKVLKQEDDAVDR